MKNTDENLTESKMTEDEASEELRKDDLSGGEVESSELRSRKPVTILAIAFALVTIVGFGAWYFLLRGEEGKSVPAPRNVSFGNETEAGDSLPSGEQRLNLTDEQLKSANLKIVEVGEAMEAAAASAATTGIVRPNEYKKTPVISQVRGVVKRIDADLGQFVRRGDTIAIISSEELARTQSKYLRMKAELDEAQKRYTRALNLSEISEESRNELDKTLATLKAAQAKLVEAKSNHQRSKKLLDIGAISQRAFEKITTELKVAEANLLESKNRFDRAGRLLRIDPARKNEIDRFLTKVRNMQADTAAVREKLLVLGISRRRVDSLRSPNQISADLPIPSPITGTVTERIANQGEVVSMNGRVAEVTDLSTIWVIGQVFEKDLGKVRVGSGASISTDSYPGELFRGKISYIDPNLDEKTRTAQVRTEIVNPNQKLKIGMYVNVAYATLGGSEKTAPLVPKEAVQTIGNQKIVFEATSDPKTFILRPVRLSGEKDASYAVIEGIFVGDRVVTEGSFLLRAEWLKTNAAKF